MAKRSKADTNKAIKNFARNRVDAFEPEPQVDVAKAIKALQKGQRRTDGWSNLITGAGVAGMDKRLGGRADWSGIMAESRAEQIYASGELERRIVELVPRECLKNWIKFKELEDAETDVEEELDRLKAAAKFYEAACWAGIYGGSALFMATGEDPADFEEPLDPKNFDKVESLVLFSRWELLVRSTDLETDINDPNYGNPKYYWLTPRKGNVSKLFSVRIHHSRLIIFGGKPLPLRLKVFNRYWDDSIYSGVIEVLRDYGISHASIASVMQEFRQVVYKIKELTEGLGSVDSEALLKRFATMNTVKSVFGAYFADMDEEVEIHSDTFAGVADMLQAIKERLQACTNIPHIILFNESPGGKSSMGNTGDSSLENWYSYLEGHQANYFKPKIDQLLAAMLDAAEGPVQGAPPDNWSWEFNKIQSMDEGAQADLEDKQYKNDAQAQALGLDSALDTMQKRRPEKFKQLNAKVTSQDKMLEATMQNLIRAQMEKFGDPATLEPTGKSGLDMKSPLFQERDKNPPTTGPRPGMGKRRTDEEPAWVAGLLEELREFGTMRLDMNENHDPANGQFSSGPGGSGDLHHTAQAAKSRKLEARLAEKGLHESHPKRVEARTQAQLHESLAHAYRGNPGVNSYLQPSQRFVKSGSKEEFEKTVKTGHFTMMTAANPMSQNVTSKDNAERMKGAIKELTARGVKFTPMVGKYGSQEPTLMVFHDEKFTPADARALGKKWTQTSVMHVKGGKGTIYYTNGEHEGKIGHSNGLEFNSEASDYYTGHQGNRFSFSFPDETWSNPSEGDPDV